MELSIGLLVESAPKQQRYNRVTHILFGLDANVQLCPDTRRRFLSAAVEYLTSGFSVCEIDQFRRSCEEHPDWPAEDCVISAAQEASVCARAEAVLQSAASCVELPFIEDVVGESHQTPLVTMKRGRLESKELREVRDQMRVVEAYADLRDYGAMSKAMSRLSVLASSLHQASVILNRVESVLVQLEVIRRSVELWLGAGNLEAVRGLVGTATATLMTQAAEYLLQVQGCGPSPLAPQQRSVENMISEMEEYMLFFSIARSLCMFVDQNFYGFACVFTEKGLRVAGWSPAVEEFNKKRNHLQVAASIGGAVNALGPFSGGHNLRQLVEASITSGPQLGVMVLFSAIAALPRAEALELVTRMDIMSLWEDVPDASALVQALQLAKWGVFFDVASVLNFSFLKTDIFACKHSEVLHRLVVQSVVLGYANAFLRLDMRKAAVQLSIPLGELQEVLRELILEGRLQARMDLVSLVLTSVKFNRDIDSYSPHSLALLDCIRRSDMAMTDIEQSLRLLSMHRNHAWH
ncbi:hypothetical protein TraAM80_09305 [Trypanosoma rangeli]|uniref:PCI domain-containing protein n=1 Tax=Trypanosoma rangeli TaxID=5698 RepID=A0A422MW72_TRYRA|nr:uncharacterized protein TraAM80_09305 [Trypanosoma rangeli]RNE97453.1 hypothetical protein TraAM80_09305 [Trypanosoma rangeli]|eukprot:RNE97453.1 hypothetical protein TraAM80_09305 [Trypanosoma rangeli]